MPAAMMTTEKPQKPFEDMIYEAAAVFEAAEQIPGLTDPSLSAFPALIRKIPEQIRAGKLKIAVVGVIKSGKSTLVNSLVGRELVKRGAGVVTAITTRIQKGRKNQARLYMKSWDEINAEIHRALALSPDKSGMKDFPHDFDIRRKKDRQSLENFYQKLIRVMPLEQDRIQPEILFIKHVLNGFDTCKDLVQSDESVISFESKEFERHKDYTADPEKAVYIRDVCLDVHGNALDPNIEMGDCQGADSTDPSQLTRIFSYLESSNLIIYCISSRIGIRQADMAFLKKIKNAGLLGHVIFINNVDLTEHDNLDDILKIEAAIRESLGLLEIDSEVFSFSALYNHFITIRARLSAKDARRLESWQKEKAMADFSNLKTIEFNAFFRQAIEKNRQRLLVSNHLNRLYVLLSDLNRRIFIFLDLLSSDKLKEEAAKKALSEFHQNSSRLEMIVANSLDSAVEGLIKEINTNIHQMFFQDKEGVVKDIQDYVQMLSMDPDGYAERETGFNEILFLMFKQFHQRVALYGLEAVRPVVNKFISLQEQRIKKYFQSLFESYQVDLFGFDRYPGFSDIVLSGHRETVAIDVADIDRMKKILGLQQPAIFDVQYTPKIKANVFAGFGLKAVSQFFSSLFDRKSDFSFTPALKKATIKLKQENRKLFRKQFEDYGADLTANYFLPLIEAATRDFKEKIHGRFRQYQSLNTEAEHFLRLKQSEKEDQKTAALSLKQRIEKLSEHLESFCKSE